MSDGESRAIPVDLDGGRVLLWVEELDDGRSEENIGWRPPTLEQALDGLMGVTKTLGARLRESEASKAVVEFGCEFAMESGSLVAVIGKATGKSTFKVTLEWTQP